MSVSPPDAPPYPTTPADEQENEESSTAAYAEILVDVYTWKKYIFIFDCFSFSFVSHFNGVLALIKIYQYSIYQ